MINILSTEQEKWENKIREDIYSLSVPTYPNGDPNYKELAEELITFMKPYIARIRLQTLQEVQGMIEREKGCRYGCFCKLCGLCDEETFIHCGECVMRKPTTALPALAAELSALIEEQEK